MHCDDVLDRLDEVENKKLVAVVKLALILGGVAEDDELIFSITSEMLVEALNELEEEDECFICNRNSGECDCPECAGKSPALEDVLEDEYVEPTPPPRDPVLKEVSDLLGVEVESLEETQLAIKLEGRNSEDAELILSKLEGKVDISLGLVRTTLEVL
jgi:hypothetical protein